MWKIIAIPTFLILKLTSKFDFIISMICGPFCIGGILCKSMITYRGHNHNYQPEKDLLLYWFNCMLHRIWQFQTPFALHYNPLLIRNRSRILTIHKDRIFWKKPPWKQRNGKKYTSRARTVFTHPGKSGKDLPSSLISIRIPNPK